MTARLPHREPSARTAALGPILYRFKVNAVVAVLTATLYKVVQPANLNDVEQIVGGLTSHSSATPACRQREHAPCARALPA